jgi:ABC-2 type transport system permease protein
MTAFPALGAALAVEARKAVASRVLRATGVMLAASVALIAGVFDLVRTSGTGDVAVKAALLMHGTGWDGLLSAAHQVTAAGGLFAFGTGLSWAVGREFSDRTVSGLFALPVPRRSIMLAKLLVYLAWSVAVTAATVALLAVVGLALGFGAHDGDPLLGLAREAVLELLSALLAVPCAWAVALSRGILAGIATGVGMVVVAQVAVAAGAGPWFPVAAPALWALGQGEVPAAALALVGVVPVLFGALAVCTFARFELDR